MSDQGVAAASAVANAGTTGATGGTGTTTAEPQTLLDLLDEAMTRFADRPALGLWHDDGSATTWTYRELDRRSRLAAWRLREQLGLQPGDRILTWARRSRPCPLPTSGRCARA